jgi:hypothetical protein
MATGGHLLYFPMSKLPATSLCGVMNPEKNQSVRLQMYIGTDTDDIS